MREFLWRIIALIVTRPVVRDWLIERSLRTPYRHITSADGSEDYMRRFWLFNPYTEALPPRWPWLPSIRIHHIRRPDQDRHLHDHPWDARTIVLDGWYLEEREPTAEESDVYFPEHGERSVYLRRAGYTGRLLFGQFHRISPVSPGGVFTLFFTWRKRGEWGFSVDGRKVPWREYLKEGGEQ